MIEEWCRKDLPDVRVQAVRLTEDNVEMVAKWCKGDLVEEIDPEHPEETQYGINLWTGMMMDRASLHMYIAKYGKNFFVSHNRVFESAYRPVNRESPPLESIGDTRKRLGFADPFGGTHAGQ